MDKAQKELINTYFRKREIADKQSYLNYELYEIKYLVINYDYNLNKLSNRYLEELLKKYPELIPIMNLEYFSDGYIYYLLGNFPQLINRVDISRISKSNTIEEILSYQPQLINAEGLNGSKFNLSKLDDNEIYHLVQKHPKLKSYFD